MIWRQLEVPATVTLAQLHEVLQTSFACSGQHLYRFSVHGREFGSGQLWLADPSTVRLADLGLRERGSGLDQSCVRGSAVARVWLVTSLSCSVSTVSSGTVAIWAVFWSMSLLGFCSARNFTVS
jgi:hypothetical protein